MFASLKILLDSILDYAGLFPSAQLSLTDAIARYQNHQTTPYAWMLGHFILPVSKLDEIAISIAETKFATFK